MSHLLKDNKYLIKLIRYFIVLTVLSLFLFGFYFYSGSKIIYILFSFLNIYLLIFAFRKKAIFFETFFALLLFLGFWFKLTLTISFTDGVFREGVGSFDYKPESFDYSLIVSIIGIMPLIICGHLREFFFYYPKKIKKIQLKNNFFNKLRKKILLIFIILILSVIILNINFMIYQKGLLPLYNYNFFLSGIVKWMLLFGLTSIASFIIFLESSVLKKIFNFTIIISIIEIFFSSLSMISRGMIFNSSSIIFGVYKLSKKSGKLLNIKKLTLYILLTFILFYISVISVNYLRVNYFYVGKSVTEAQKIIPYDETITETVKKKEFNIINSNNELFYLAINRWVGIDAIFAVSQQRKILNYDLLLKALKEKPNKNEPTFYEKTFKLENFLQGIQYENVKGNTLTGIIAFLFYSGSFTFLFFGMFILNLFATLLEIISFYASRHNLIFTAIIGQVIAFRYIHFGYLPNQSYLLLGSIILTILFSAIFVKFFLKQ